MLSITQTKGGYVAIGIMPGVEIHIHIARVEHGTVQLAIDCPRDFPIYRKEVYEKLGGFMPEDFERAQDREHRAKPASGMEYRYSTPEKDDGERKS